MKLCIKCKIKKKNSDFYKHSNVKDGLSSACKVCTTVHNKKYRSTKEGFLKNALSSAKVRAKKKQINFNLDYEYLESISTTKCPVFNVDLMYYSSTNGSGYPNPHAASLDRVIPELGYVKGNVVFISQWANTVKSNATEIQLYAVADWLHEKRKEVLNAFKEQSSPVSEGHSGEGEVYPELGSVSTPWTWEDDDDAHYHSGADARKDADHRAQESGGDGLGRGGTEVAAPEPLTRLEDHGQPDAEIIRLDFGGRHIPD